MLDFISTATSNLILDSYVYLFWGETALALARPIESDFFFFNHKIGPVSLLQSVRAGMM